MKHAVSISIGSSRRDKTVEVNLLGQPVRLERIGTDGDMKKAARLYQEMDGQVDAFGVGGAVLGVMVENRWNTMHSAQALVRNVHKTPVVDGTGLKMTLEKQVARVIEQRIPADSQLKRAFVAMAVDRWGTARSFLDAGYQVVFGDLMFGLGLPIPLRSERAIRLAARLLLSIVTHLPFAWVYPTGKKQEQRQPKWESCFQWAGVVAGDCHYLWRHMPERLEGKIIVTNTTTLEDQAFFRQAGIKYLITTTPVLEGRSFGTNLIEAGIIAALGRTEPVDYAHPGDYFEQMQRCIDLLHMEPQVQEL